MKDTTRTLRNGHGSHEPMQRLAAAVHRTVDRVAEGARAIDEDVRYRTAELGSHAREQEKRARAAAERGARKARAYLRKRPLFGAGIAAGVALTVGAVLGAVLLRR